MRTKKVSFYDESASEERLPLLSPPDPKDEKAAKLETEEISPAGDAVAELEGLSRLLVRSCKVFTVASCASVLLGSLRSGYVESMGVMWCTLPVWLACLWFVAEIVLSFSRVRRVLLAEERRRKLSVRRMRRRLRRIDAPPGAAAAPPTGGGRQTHTSAGLVLGKDGAEAGGGGRSGGGKEDDDGGGGSGGRGDGFGAGTSSPLSLGRPALARAPSSRLRRHVSRGLSASASTPSPTEIAEQGERDAEGWFSGDSVIGGGGTGGGGRQIGTAAALSTPESQPKMAPREGVSYDGGDGDGGDDDDDDYIKTTLFAAPADHPKLNKSSSLSRSLSLKPPPSSPSPAPPSRNPRREVQVSFLLQAWLRLWATMVFFAVVLIVFMTLLSLRLFGFEGVSAGWIGSPCIFALVVLGLHSLLLLDGSGGVGGGPVMRGGGNRLVVGLGRRPVILLTLVSSVLVVLKIDSAAFDSSSNSGSLWAVTVLVGKVHWGFVFFPLWIMLFLLEVVYIVSLWENHAGVSLARSLGVSGGSKGGEYGGGGVVGGPDGGGPCCCIKDNVTGSFSLDSPRRWWWCRRRGSGEKGEYERLDADDTGSAGGGGQQQHGARGGSRAAELRRREQHQRHAPAGEGATACLAYPIGGSGGGGGGGGGFLRRRVELTPSQRAAASSIAAGLFLLTMTVISVTVGSSREQASWGIPATFVTAAAGLALVGAGFVSLASAYDRMLRGPLPPIVKPLPVVYSEPDGGWIVGPPDPPVVSVFLLGDVVLRTEDREHGWAAAGGGGSGGMGLGEAEEDDRWGSTC
eukprot:g6776.t1